MSDLQTQEIQLKPGMIEFLEDTAKTFKLADSGKAIRCLVNYARENPDKCKEIFERLSTGGA